MENELLEQNSIQRNDKIGETKVVRTRRTVTKKLSEKTNIAYKILCDDLKELIYDINGNGEEEINPNLLGLQFEFKPVNGTYFDYVKVMKIHYFPTSSEVFYKEDLNRVLSEDEMYTIKTQGTVQHSILDQVYGPGKDGREDYSCLDFFPDPMDKNKTEVVSVLFTVSEIRPLVDYFQYVILSGCQLHLGRKLSQPPINGEGLNFDDYYFTLKMEGFGKKNVAILNTNVDTKLIPAEGPGFAVGPPCPPTWYNFSAAVPSMYKIYIEQSSEQDNKSLDGLLRTKKALPKPFYNTIPQLWARWKKNIINSKGIKSREFEKIRCQYNSSNHSCDCEQDDQLYKTFLRLLMLMNKGNKHF